ncbi:MAG: hypothetical protein P1P88_25510 [Bacteroidales bacterium]|nr:hypothetical protein [Bacteroidales bacterium]
MSLLREVNIFVTRIVPVCKSVINGFTRWLYNILFPGVLDVTRNFTGTFRNALNNRIKIKIPGYSGIFS